MPSTVTLTLTSDLLTPKSGEFISVQHSIVYVSFMKNPSNVFHEIVLTMFRAHARTYKTETLSSGRTTWCRRRRYRIASEGRSFAPR